MNDRAQAAPTASPAPASADADDGQARRLLALLGVAVTAGFEAGAIGFVLPAMRAATGASAQEASWLLTAFIAATLVAVPACALAARQGMALRLLRACLLLAVVSGALAAVLPVTLPLLLARVLQGLAHGPLLPLVAAVVVMHFAPQRQGRLLGLVSMAYGLAFVLGTVGSPWLLQYSWRSAFALGSVLALLSLAWRLPAAAPVPTATTAALPAASGWRLALSVPMRPVVALALGIGVGQATLVWVPTLAVARLGLGMTDIAPLLVPMLLGGLIATASVIRWLDRLGARPLVLLGAAAALAGLALAVAGPAVRVVFMVGGAGLGFGIGLLSGGPLRYAAARALPREAQGLAQGTVAWITDLGLLGGSVLLGQLAGQGADARSGVESALVMAGIVMALCVPAVLWLPRPVVAPA